ncbi:MAG: hypothetical protein A3E78_00845 [Alphaproteobacteria bacterium RIFCSPHIGHO2_12_FULL_63_12]|nr:MAG: hypothetical protein A3E78_00845 [Alphaproteobacteria bacterium RIFCSPHIGHO2_12_FULL_63_12]
MTLSHDQLKSPRAASDIGAENAPAVFFKRSAAMFIVSAVFVVSVAFYWHGFGPMGDAERYVAAALEWRDEGFYLGETHWALRHLFVLPMAAIFTLFGTSEFAATIPNILYAAGLVAVTLYFGRKYLGEGEGTIAAILVAISAYFVSRPVQIGVYGAEIFFAAIACWLFVSAQMARRRIFCLVAAGVFAGLAWTIREQTLFLIVAFGLSSLFDRRQPLLSLAAIGIGFGSVLAVEWIIYWLSAGDPFYRYRIDLDHRSTGWATLDSSSDPWTAKLFRPFKDLSTDPLTTPTVLIAAVAAATLGQRWLRARFAHRSVLSLFAAFSAIAAVTSAYAFDLATPRYYPILPYFVCLFLGVAIVGIGKKFGTPAAISIGVMAALANAAGDDFGNYNEYAEARTLARYVQANDEPVFTDPLTASRTRNLLRLSGLSGDRISTLIRSDKTYPAGVLLYKAAPSSTQLGYWCSIARLDVRTDSWTHAIIRFFNIDNTIGGSLESIAAKPEPVEFIRVLPRAADHDPISGRECLPTLKTKKALQSQRL